MGRLLRREDGSLLFILPALESSLLDPLLESSSLDTLWNLLHSTLYWSLLV